MISILKEMLSYPFLVRALVVGVLVSLCAALLGVSLVLKRYSMIGDGLSHVGFGALAIATALNLAPLAVAIPVVVLAAFLLLRLSQNGKLKGDAAIALLSSSALAIGVMTVSMTSGMNTDVNNYMFGSILSLSSADLRLSLILSAAVLALLIGGTTGHIIGIDRRLANISKLLPATGGSETVQTLLVAFTLYCISDIIPDATAAPMPPEITAIIICTVTLQPPSSARTARECRHCCLP